MIKKIIQTYLSFMTLICIPQENMSEIIISFDVNKTIIASDLVQNKTIDQTINAILAECTYADWDTSGTTQSYYAFITKQLINHYPFLKVTSEAFKTIRNEKIAQFPIYLNQNAPLEMLTTYVSEKEKMLMILNNEELALFPSFIKVIYWLTKNYPQKHTIYLRTFGKDIPHILPIIQQKTGLIFSGIGKFENKELHLNLNQEIVVYENPVEFLLTPHHKHYALQDDYTSWKNSGFTTQGAKPFAVAPDIHKICTLFFDDNASDQEKPIICPLNSEQQLLQTEELLLSGHIIAVNPKDAILDEDYFIKKIEQLLTHTM